MEEEIELLNGKTVIVTGSNCGIGFETALDLAKRKAYVILACRDENKARIATEKIKSQSNNLSVEYELVDLGNLRSIKLFSERILAKLTKLDILINNAGVFGSDERATTYDGYELTFGVNHLGHFYLTKLLLELIKKSAPSRIINVSSKAHYWGSINFNDLQAENNYSPISAYNNSKLAK